MGFVGSLFDSENGMGFKASTAPIVEAATKEQADETYRNSQNALAQQNFLQQAALQQNGFQNQSALYNQYGQIAQGQGPNPAAAQLANATGANNAAQAALMAGQRGAGANTGLIARQAGMQGSANQQNAIGQAAALQAQQSLGAMNAQAGLANQQAQNAIGTTANYNQYAQGLQSNVLNALGQQNNATVAMQNGVNNANASIQGAIAGEQGQLLSKAADAGSNAAAPKKAAQGGMAIGGNIVGADGALAPSMKENYSAPGPSSRTFQHLHRHYAQGGSVQGENTPVVPGKPKVNHNSYSNDTIDAKLSPGEIILPLSVTKAKDPVKAASAFVAAVLAKQGLKR